MRLNLSEISSNVDDILSAEFVRDAQPQLNEMSSNFSIHSEENIEKYHQLIGRFTRPRQVYPTYKQSFTQRSERAVAGDTVLKQPIKSNMKMKIGVFSECVHEQIAPHFPRQAHLQQKTGIVRQYVAPSQSPIKSEQIKQQAHLQQKIGIVGQYVVPSQTPNKKREQVNQNIDLPITDKQSLNQIILQKLQHLEGMLSHQRAEPARQTDTFYAQSKLNQSQKSCKQSQYIQHSRFGFQHLIVHPPQSKPNKSELLRKQAFLKTTNKSNRQRTTKADPIAKQDIKELYRMVSKGQVNQALERAILSNDHLAILQVMEYIPDISQLSLSNLRKAKEQAEHYFRGDFFSGQKLGPIIDRFTHQQLIRTYDILKSQYKQPGFI